MNAFQLHLLAGTAIAALVGGSGPSPAMSLPFATSRSLTDTVNSKLVTYTGASLSTMYDSTGKLTYKPNNIVLDSNTFSGWAQSSGTTVTANAGTDPFGGSAAAEIVMTSTAYHYFQSGKMSAGGFNQNYPQVFSCYVKGTNGGKVAFRVSVGTSDYTLHTFDGTWQRVSIRFQPTSNTGDVGFDCRAVIDAALGTAQTFLAYGFQVEAVTYETSPRTYNATTGSAYYGPRFDYNPATLASRGLLVEQESTNVALQSGDISNAAWTNSGTTIALNNATGIDGQASLTRFTMSAGTTAKWFYNTSAYGSASATASFYAKAGTISWICISSSAPGTDGVYFDLTNGVVGTQKGSSVGKITNVGNGIYRCEAYIPSRTYMTVSFHSADNQVATWNAAGTETIFVQFPQNEVVAFATSYIPTAGSSVTRAADSASMTGTDFSGWWNATEGTFVANAISLGGDATYGAATILRAEAGSDSYFIDLLVYPTGDSFRVYDGGAAQASILTGTAFNTNYKMAGAYKANDFAACKNAGTVAADGTGSIPSPTSMGIGQDPSDGGYKLNGWIASIDYYDTRLSDATLQSLTS